MYRLGRRLRQIRRRAAHGLPERIRTRRVSGSMGGGTIIFLALVIDKVATIWTTPGDIVSMIKTLGVWSFALLGLGLILWANWPEIKKRFHPASEDKEPIKREIKTLTGVMTHASNMLKKLPRKYTTLSHPQYEGHMQTIVINIGNSIPLTRKLGAFDQYVDLLIILDGVENESHGWLTGNKAIDSFQGFWYWLKPQVPEYEERGDNRVYAIERYIEIIDARITELKEIL